MNQAEKISARIPRRQYYLQQYTALLGQMVQEARTRNERLDALGWCGRRVLGFKLPVWQRQRAWDDGQAVRFIESIWLGVGLGTYIVNSVMDTDLDQILLDGQQRIQAIERYLNGELRVSGEDGRTYRWTDLTAEEQAQFNRIPFSWCSTSYGSEDECKRAYNRHNFGGTAHREDERA